METKIKEAIETYQCPGCALGYNTACFQPTDHGSGCGKHYAGTMASGIGSFFLGMPKGFNRVGHMDNSKFRPRIWDTFGDNYDVFNIPVWKHKNAAGHTIVRGIMPRRNEPFIDIFLEDCMDKIHCQEITEDDINGMD